MSRDIALILEDCLARMRAGSDLETCLLFYPKEEEELRPLLSEAAYLRSIPAPKARLAAKEAGRQRMFAALDQQSWVRNSPQTNLPESLSARYSQRNRTKFAPVFAFGFVFLLIFTGAFLMFAGILTVKASANAIPGDPLYRVKRSWEKVQLAITTQDRQQLQSQFASERRAEIAKLLKLHRDAVMEFEGLLEQISDDHFVVSGIAVRITSKTNIEGIPIVGQKAAMQIHVQSDGQLIAQKLSVEETAPHETVPVVPPTLTPTPTSTAVPSTTPTSTMTPSPTPTLTVMPLVVPLPICDDGDCENDDSGDDDDKGDDSLDDDSEDDDSEDDDSEDDD